VDDAKCPEGAVALGDATTVRSEQEIYATLSDAEERALQA
jgi:hypothetical protein